MISELCNRIFLQSVQDYHIYNDADAPENNPYAGDSIEFLFYKKNWIDTVQWHLEDIIREPSIDPVFALQLKRRIDASNEERTNIVEYIDSFFLQQYKDVEVREDATFNTESPAWAIDRLSILTLKIYHMRLEAEREDATKEHRLVCGKKLDILLQQQTDLSTAIDELLQEIEQGKKYMKVYKQMKMYNNPLLNPVLYGKKN
jgi:hypothetical protein